MKPEIKKFWIYVFKLAVAIIILLLCMIGEPVINYYLKS